MSDNDYFNDPTDIVPYTPGRPGPINDMFRAVSEGFDKLPGLDEFGRNMRALVAAGGTANALTITYPGDPVTSYDEGQIVSFKAAFDNTNTVTVNVDGLGVKPIVTDSGDPLTPGSLQAGGIYDATYDGTVFQLVGGGATYLALAKAEVTYATAQADRAEDEADSAQTFSISAGNSATAAAASAAAAAKSAKDAALFDPSTYYTKAETDAQIDGLTKGAPTNLNSFAELAAAVGNDPTFSITIDTRIDAIEATGILPLGTIVRTYSTRSDLVLANGAYVPKATYPALFNLRYGSRNWAGYKMPQPASVPTSGANGTSQAQAIAWQPTGSKLAIATGAAASHLEVYDWNGGAPIKLAALPAVAAADGYSTSWSPNGRYLVGGFASGAVWVYDWQSGSPVVVSTFGGSVGTAVNGSAWSANSRYLVIAAQTGPNSSYTDMNSGTPAPTALPSPPSGVCYTAAWSPNGRYSIIGHSNSARGYFTIWDWNTGSPVVLADPAVGAGQPVYAAAFSGDSRYFIVVNASGDFKLYDMNTGAPVNIAFPGGPASTTVNDVAWSSNSAIIAFALNTSVGVKLYSWASGVPTALNDPAEPVGQAVKALDFQPGDAVLALALSSGPYIVFYQVDLVNATTFPLPNIVTTDPPTYVKAMP